MFLLRHGTIEVGLLVAKQVFFNGNNSRKLENTQMGVVLKPT